MSDYIPEELQAQILKLLPVKSLQRFRSVCKWWKQLIDSESFMQHHLSLQNPKFIFEYEEPNFLVLDPKALPSFDTLFWSNSKDNRCHIIGTLHGVVCLVYYNHILLWNPSIRKFSCPPEADQFWDWELCTKRSAEGDMSAFWINPCTKEFKIVDFRLTLDSEYQDMARLYSSILQGYVFLRRGEACGPLVQDSYVIMGALAYWPCLKFTDESEMDVMVVVLSFDFDREIFEVIDAPHYDLDVVGSFDPVLCKLKGFLSLVYLDPTHRCEVYSRKEQGLWVHLFGFTVQSHITRIRMVVDEEGREDNTRVVASTDTELVLCETAGVGHCITLKTGIKNPYMNVAGDFVESLLLP